MGVIAEGIPRGCQGLFTPVSLGYPLSVFNKNSTFKKKENQHLGATTRHVGRMIEDNSVPFVLIVPCSSC